LSAVPWRPTEPDTASDYRDALDPDALRCVVVEVAVVGVVDVLLFVVDVLVVGEVLPAAAPLVVDVVPVDVLPAVDVPAISASACFVAVCAAVVESTPDLSV
jgi:hypothetical protein